MDVERTFRSTKIALSCAVQVRGRIVPTLFLADYIIDIARFEFLTGTAFRLVTKVQSCLLIPQAREWQFHCPPSEFYFSGRKPGRGPSSTW